MKNKFKLKTKRIKIELLFEKSLNFFQILDHNLYLIINKAPYSKHVLLSWQVKKLIFSTFSIRFKKKFSLF